MKMKYISLAVTAALSTTVLTACGSSSNDAVVAPSPIGTDTAAEAAAKAKAEAEAKAKAEAEAKAKAEAEAKAAATLQTTQQKAKTDAAAAVVAADAAVKAAADAKAAATTEAQKTAAAAAEKAAADAKTAATAATTAANTAATQAAADAAVKAAADAQKAATDAQKAATDAKNATSTTGAGGATAGSQVSGNAATAAATDAKPTVLGQQYQRREGSNFDRVKDASGNPVTNAYAGDNRGIPTINSNTTLQDKKMQNIVLGSEQNERNGTKVKVARYAGKIDNTDPVNVNYPADGARVTLDINGKEATLTSLGLSATPETLQDRNVKNALVSTTQVYSNGNTKVLDNTGLYYTGINGKAKNTLETKDDATETRIFGRNYREATLADDANIANSYRQKEAVTGASVVKTQHLSNVQYGRVSNNIDPLLEAEVQKAPYYVAAPYEARNGAKAVNTYFYRGLNETTIDQMKTLQAAEAGKVLTYYGHALTYGINDGYSKSAADLNSNAPGADTFTTTLGDFVKADYDVNAKTVAGNIYNVKFNSDKDAASLANAAGVQNNLIGFTGTVTGNSIKGTADNKINTEKGAFEGSFFGANAEEMGGAVNSITTGYGVANWGAVFGAKRDIVVAPVQPPVQPPKTADNVVTAE